jgi:hypothetical protein
MSSGERIAITLMLTGIAWMLRAMADALGLDIGWLFTVGSLTFTVGMLVMLFDIGKGDNKNDAD